MKFFRILSCCILSLMLALSLTACAKQEFKYAGVRYNRDKTPECYLINYTNVHGKELRLNFSIGYIYNFNGETHPGSTYLSTTEFQMNWDKYSTFEEALEARTYTLKPNESITLIFRPFEESAALFFENIKVMLDVRSGEDWVSEGELELPAMNTEQDLWDMRFPTDTSSIAIG